jgi:hypothetical protein
MAAASGATSAHREIAPVKFQSFIKPDIADAESVRVVKRQMNGTHQEQTVFPKLTHLVPRGVAPDEADGSEVTSLSAI